MAALENDRPPLAAVLKNITHHIIARVVFIATCRLRSSPRNSPSSLGYTAVSSLSLCRFVLSRLCIGRSPFRQHASGKMRNDRGSIRAGSCLKFMNDFTATSPIVERHKRPKARGHIERESGPHFRAMRTTRAE